jgi:Right handed beta helix region
MAAKNVSSGGVRAGGIGLALTFLMMSSAIYADTMPCVNSDAELVSALNLAEGSAQTIMLVQGTYHLNATAWNAKLSSPGRGKFRAGSSLTGGYTDATCTTRDIDVNNTFITDTTSNPDDEVNILGDATIQGITFQLPNGLIIGADSTANNPLPAGSELDIRRNVFTQTTGASKQPLEIEWNEDASVGGVVRIVNNLLHDNSGGGGPANSAAIFFLLDDGKPTIELINNTVVDNGGSLGGFGLLNLSATPVYAYNNIFYGNSGSDFAVFFGSPLTLVDNVIGTHSYSGSTITASGTTSADPKLDVNFRPIEAPVSNVINTGTDAVMGGLPATDLPGRTREIGSEPDRGAFESSINNSTSQVVTTASDAVPAPLGSLRAAIANANAAPAGQSTTVTFDLGSNCPYVISPTAVLPLITSSIKFEGYSQAGSSANDLEFGDDANICVILDGSAHSILDGLYVPTGIADSVEVQISGLAFGGFSHGAISLYGGSGHIVTGSRIGGSASGTALSPVANGIILGPGVHDVTIGGGFNTTDVDLRNIIGNATGDGIVLDGTSGALPAAHNNHILNNYIGLGWSTSGEGSFTNLGNGGNGITIAGDHNDVESNEIEFNTVYGLELTSTGANTNEILDNFIGYLYGETDAGNAGGIVVTNDAHDNSLNGNVVYNNSGTGIRIVTGQGNAIFENQTYANGGLGIDLAVAGVTLNDDDSASQPADYANRGQNFPVLTGAIGGHTKGMISGTLTSTPGDYHVELFASAGCDPSGYGEGEFEIAYFAVTIPTPIIGGQSTVSFSVPPSYPVSFATVPIITATAIDENQNTSEFSKCFTYTDDTLFANGFEE